MSQFPATRISLVAGLHSDQTAVRERAMELVARAYREPIVTVLQHQWSLARADAEDLAHDFFEQALSKHWLERFDPERGRFRTFLRSCLFAYASTAHEAQTRLKRGGGTRQVSLDDVDLHTTVAPEVESLFDREWTRAVLELSMDALQQECQREGKEPALAVFIARDVQGAEQSSPPSYQELADRFDVPPTQVTNYLNWARRRFRHHVLETLRALTGTDDEFRAEARSLLGVDLT
ncbi:MAG: hypothetical protein U0132_08420 [Gemmatimonadaceae bacterium]